MLCVREGVVTYIRPSSGPQQSPPAAVDVSYRHFSAESLPRKCPLISNEPCCLSALRTHSHLPWQSPLHKGSTVPTSPLSNLFPFTLRGLCHEIPVYEYCLATLHIMDAYQTRKIADYIIHHQHWTVVGQSWRLKLSKSQFVHLANWNNNFHVAVYLKEKYKVII